MQRFKEELREELLKPLPAHSAHRKVMSHRKAIDQLGSISNTAKQSAVLILIYPKDQKLHTVFILRSTYKGVHSGQIGFPGGKIEEIDLNLEAAALREANEELNIKAHELDVIGSLTPLYVPPSNFVINPFVAVQESTPRFIPDEREVNEVLESPLLDLVGEDKLVPTKVKVDQALIHTNGFALQNRIIWGATAMMLKEFTEVLERVKSPIGLI